MEKAKGYLAKFWLWPKNFALQRPWWTTILVIILAGGGFWYYRSATAVPDITTVEVKRGTVAQVISVTGIVKPAEEVNLSFEKGGRVFGVYKNVGDRVSIWQLLVSLENLDISAQLDQAKAVVKAEKAKLDELKNGTRPEDIAVSEVAVSNAKNDVINDIKNAYVNADDAIHNKVDQFFSNPKSPTPQLNFILSNYQLENDIESGRVSMEATLASLNNTAVNTGVSSDLASAIRETRDNLRTVQSYLDKVATAVNSLTPTSNISQTTIDSYKSGVLSGRANVTTALEYLTTAEEKLNNAASALLLKQAGSTPEKITAQEAVLEGAAASVKNLEAQLNKTMIFSPISGLVTKQEAKTGQIAPAGTVIVSVISDTKYQIEANVPEADFAKIKIGDIAEVNLDAYGSDIFFEAVVTKIDPAETIIDGVATYKTTLQFKINDGRIRSGMTANTDIFGEKRDNVLFIPGRVIATKGGTKSVTILSGTETREVTVTTGLRGSDGNVEIISGLKEGDRIKTN